MAANLDHTSIVNIILEASADLLNRRLRIEQDDDAKAGLIRTGRLQDDPTNRKINILLHTGGEEWPDVLNIINEPTDRAGIHAPTYEMGSQFASFYFRRRIVIELSLFYSNQSSRDDARRRSQVVLGRAHNAFATWDVGAETQRDSFGEHAFGVQVVRTYLEEGGGEGDFNWRGEMYVEFLTSYEPVVFPPPPPEDP